MHNNSRVSYFLSLRSYLKTVNARYYRVMVDKNYQINLLMAQDIHYNLFFYHVSGLTLDFSAYFVLCLSFFIYYITVK